MMFRVVTNIAFSIFMVCGLISIDCIAQTSNNPIDIDNLSMLETSNRSKEMISIETLIFVVDADKKIDLGFFNENIVVNNDFSLDALMDLINKGEAENGLRIIGKPHIKVIEGKTAEFKVEDDETGELFLKVTPQLTDARTADYKIEVVKRRAYAARGDVVRRRTSSSSVTVKDGGTFAIGGITARDVGITNGGQRELCMFLTPHIVKQKAR